MTGRWHRLDWQSWKVHTDGTFVRRYSTCQSAVKGPELDTIDMFGTIAPPIYTNCGPGFGVAATLDATRRRGVEIRQEILARLL